MTALRRLFLTHRRAAALLVLFALAMRVLVPAGFMPVLAGGEASLAICDGQGPVALPAAPGPHDAMAGMHHPAPDAPAKAEPPCGFAGAAMPSLAGVDPVWLIVAIGFVMALGVRTSTPLRLAARGHVRPPLRGPPALA